ncbi:MerR family transcriptional regulator [Streptomyces johnsoniae]|uniref:MerR family transcriptional regulator n=1 Tax=Streptomyces johnsoniae TaxID=3075532 RepID=A0ABU2SDL2_9ACTN|nr:MerR family transcriptional regulator [Streptomyces sp. DSM 41886]MDT0447068.1 MerR family transcriptional regulator [Streptomyces sp. DSM 41886]
MRIGELAALAGVTTRTIRHYHHVGLLPESPREANGYRSYGLSDAIRLARIRRLTELGLGLEEIRDVLSDDTAHELDEVLAELDDDLAAQEEAIRRRRERLSEVLRQAGENGGLPREGPVSPELAALFTEMSRASAELPGPEPRMAAKERELLALLEAAPAPGAAEWLGGLLRALKSEPGALRRAYEVYAQMDGLADAAADDPRVPAVARALVAALPAEIAAPMAEAAGQTSGMRGGGGFEGAFFAEFSAAQAEAVWQAMRLIAERGGR